MCFLPFAADSLAEVDVVDTAGGSYAQASGPAEGNSDRYRSGSISEIVEGYYPGCQIGSLLTAGISGPRVWDVAGLTPAVESSDSCGGRCSVDNY